MVGKATQGSVHDLIVISFMLFIFLFGNFLKEREVTYRGGKGIVRSIFGISINFLSA